MDAVVFVSDLIDEALFQPGPPIVMHVHVTWFASARHREIAEVNLKFLSVSSEQRRDIAHELRQVFALEFLPGRPVKVLGENIDTAAPLELLDDGRIEAVRLGLDGRVVAVQAEVYSVHAGLEAFLDVAEHEVPALLVGVRQRVGEPALAATKGEEIV